MLPVSLCPGIVVRSCCCRDVTGLTTSTTGEYWHTSNPIRDPHVMHEDSTGDRILRATKYTHHCSHLILHKVQTITGRCSADALYEADKVATCTLYSVSLPPTRTGRGEMISLSPRLAIVRICLAIF